MLWHIISRVGSSDEFSPDISDKTPRVNLSYFNAPGDRVPENVFENLLKMAPSVSTEQVFDLTVLGMSVYSADHCVKRRGYSPDSWTRDISLYLPVADVDLWLSARGELQKMLTFLSGDHWNLEFRKRDYTPTLSSDRGQEITTTAVALFSGGVDSLVGALDILERDESVTLVGHYGPGITHPKQVELLQLLQVYYSSLISFCLFFVDPPRIDDLDRETTKRSRSLLFLTLGLLTADTLGENLPLIVSENGLISLNVPLTPARSGSLSTRTTHPYFIELFKQCLDKLGIGNEIVLPYKFATKGEMLAQSKAQQQLKQLLPLSISCAHPEQGRWQGATPGTHCGYCFPCLIRRAAVASANLPDATYTIDVLTSPPDHKSETGRDYRALKIALERFLTSKRNRDVVNVLAAGPLPADQSSQYLSTYRNGIQELLDYYG